MPSKLEVSDHLVFLYDCFESAKQNGGKVDKEAVGAIHGLNTNAVGMRLHRLGKSIETGRKNVQGVVDGSEGAESTPKASLDAGETTPKTKASKKASPKKASAKKTGTTPKAKKASKRKAEVMDEVSDNGDSDDNEEEQVLKKLKQELDEISGDEEEQGLKKLKQEMSEV